MNILCQFFVTECRRCGSWYCADIILIFPAKSLIAVDFVFCHRLIVIADAREGTFETALPFIIAGTLYKIHAWYFCGNEISSVFPEYCDQGTDRRLHLQALFRYFLLQVLRIVDAGFCVIVLFVNAKNENSAIILVGEAGERIIETLRTSFPGAF